MNNTQSTPHPNPLPKGERGLLGVANKKPLIGLTMDHENGGRKECGQYSLKPWYAIRENYCTAISDIGGIAIPLVHDMAMIKEMANLLDGLIATGGAFDIPPSYYGEEEIHPKVSLKESRSIFEIGIMREMLKRDKPVLGICGGQQLINVCFGGSLYQHLPEHYGEINHEQENPRDEVGHEVDISKNTMLYQIIGKDKIGVNSAHHQAVRKAADGLLVNARSTDGVIEGIEHPQHKFCLGVQWHPEYHVSEADKRIFEAFMKAC
jgi:putative glutamine amidotransferase